MSAMFYGAYAMLRRYQKLKYYESIPNNWKSIIINDDDRLKYQTDFVRKMISKQQYTDDENFNVFQHPGIQEAIANYIDKRGYLFQG